MKYNTESIEQLYSSILSKIEIDETIKDLLHTQLKSFGSLITREELEDFRDTLTHDLAILSYITGQIILLNSAKDIVVLSKSEIDLYTNLSLRYLENEQLFERNLK